MRQFILSIILSLPLVATAQKYPQGYFRNPLDIPILLAGNFGECRSNHFHSGLDIRTQSKENLVVRAAADGYVSRVRMQNGGFGHALYLTHPNGYTTLYAHLNDFAPEIQAYMKAEQYKRKSWTLDLYVPASKFPVKKGDLIAYSGNTGSSLAPHLHFEIRDSKTEHPVNPALFGFNITDNIPPKLSQVVLYNMKRSIYEQKLKTVNITTNKNGYAIKDDTVFVEFPLVGVGFKANDYMNNSTNTLTYHIAELSMDEQVQCRLTLDDIGYDVTRYMNAFADYSQKRKGNGWVQCMFRLPGNHLPGVYEHNKNKGALDISDGEPHEILLSMTDAFGNTSAAKFYMKFIGELNDTLPDCEHIFKVNQPNSFVHPNVKFALDRNDIYDEICFEFHEEEDAKAYSARYHLHDLTVPIHSYFMLYIKPDKPVPFELRDKIALVENEGGGSESAKAATYDNGWYRASIRNFGEYRLEADTQPPKIIPMQSRTALLKSSRITFKVDENLTSVDKFVAKMDGNWIPFEQTGDVFYYEFDDHCGKGDHVLSVTATDENGNSESIEYTFKRQ